MKRPNCKDCTLTGTKVRGKGVGSNPSIVFVGEAPGAEEIKFGEPFIGSAGQVIRGVCENVGVTEEHIYFTNVCLCRPPENRNPSTAEIEACKDRLLSEIQELDPDYVIALGAVPAKVLFPGKTLKKHRGRFFESTAGVEGLLTYHPAATLYHKGDTILPYIISDVKRVWRRITGFELDAELSNPHTETFLVEDGDDLLALFKRLEELPFKTTIALDWETTGVKPPTAVGVCMGLSWKIGTGVAVPAWMVRHQIGRFKAALSRHRLVGYNVMFDSRFNKILGLPHVFDEDAMLLHYLLDERPQQRSLENISIQELDIPPYESEMLAKYECSKSEMVKKVPLEEIMYYCAKDVDTTLRLVNLFLPQVKECTGLTHVYRELLMPGAHVLADIYQTGIWVDQEKLQTVATDYEQMCDESAESLRGLTGLSEFNPRSHPQVQNYIWDVLKLKEPNIFGRNNRSADKKTLTALLEAYPEQPFVSLLQEYRNLYTNYSKYLANIGEYIDHDNRVRTNMHLDRTETGRMSTTAPALHQIPREGTIRSIYSAPPGRMLIQADYAQIEMRVAAMVAGDESLTKLMQELEVDESDFHSYMASLAFRVPPDTVTPEQRQAAKAVSFGLLYLMSDKGLALATGLPMGKAKQFVSSYKNLMPKVQKAIEETKKQVRELRYVESMSGRRRRFPLLTNHNIEGLYREAVNFKLGQSPASDITLYSTIKLHSFLQRHYPEAKIVLIVHDSIIVDSPAAIANEVAKHMKIIMEDVLFTTNVPFPVEIKIGQRWGEGDLYE